MEEDIEVINLTPETIANYGVCGYKDVEKHVELRNKINWYKQYYLKGLKIKTHTDAQQTPSPFDTFCIVYKGKVLTHSPISNTRFDNIMNELKG